MRVLLDTHVALWVAVNHGAVGQRTRRMIDNASAVLISAASLWEMEIKRDLGTIDLPSDMRAELHAIGMSELPISGAHVMRTSGVRLPHRDPFDRLLVAQALAEGAILVTADRAILSAGLDMVQDARE